MPACPSPAQVHPDRGLHASTTCTCPPCACSPLAHSLGATPLARASTDGAPVRVAPSSSRPKQKPQPDQAPLHLHLHICASCGCRHVCAGRMYCRTYRTCTRLLHRLTCDSPHKPATAHSSTLLPAIVCSFRPTMLASTVTYPKSTRAAYFFILPQGAAAHISTHQRTKRIAVEPSGIGRARLWRAEAYRCAGGRRNGCVVSRYGTCPRLCSQQFSWQDFA